MHRWSQVFIIFDWFLFVGLRLLETIAGLKSTPGRLAQNDSDHLHRRTVGAKTVHLSRKD
jgi:hypothetical protein